MSRFAFDRFICHAWMETPDCIHFLCMDVSFNAFSTADQMKMPILICLYSTVATASVKLSQTMCIVAAVDSFELPCFLKV